MRTRQSKTSGKFGAGENTLSTVDTSSAEKVQQGVVSRVGEEQTTLREGIDAAGTGISGAIDQGKEDYDDAQILEARAAHQQNIDDYLYNVDKDKVSDAEAHQEVLDANEHVAWSAFGKEGPDGETKGVEVTKIVNLAQAAAKKQQAVVLKAKEQGIISASEFMRRTTLINKAFVAANPSIAGELMADQKLLWDVAGVRTNIDLDAAEAKSQAAAEKQVITQELAAYSRAFPDRAIPLRNGLPNRALIREQLYERSKVTEDDRLVDEAIKSNDADQQLYIQQLFKQDNTGESPASRKIKNFGSDLMKLNFDSIMAIRELPEEGVAGVHKGRAAELELVMLKIKTDVANAHETLAQSFLGLDSKVLTAYQVNFKATTTAFVELLSNAASFEEQVKIQKNMDVIQTSAETLAFRKATGYTEKELNFLAKGLQGTNLSTLVSTNPELAKRITGIMMTASSNVSGVRNRTDVAGDDGVAMGVSSKTAAAASASDPDNQTGKDIYSNIVETEHMGINQFANKKEQFGYIHRTIKGYAGVEHRAGAGGLNPRARNKADLTIRAGGAVYSRNLAKDIASTRDNYGTKVRVTFEDGEISFTHGLIDGVPDEGVGNNFLDKLTKTYSQNVRTLTRAVANMNGWAADDARTHQKVLDFMPAIKEELEANEALTQGRAGGRTRLDGSTKSKQGFLGPHKNKAGETVTEKGMEVQIGTQQVYIPLMVNGLSTEQVDMVVEGKPDNDIIDIAIKSYHKRIKAGLNPFFSENESSNKLKASVKPTNNNPLNLRHVGSKLFRTYATLEEGLQSNAHQIYRYTTGDTTGTKLQTPATITGTWNNEKEKGSMSAKNYLSVVVKNSGIGADEKIDINDIDDVANLMFGMAKAEDRNTKLTVRGIKKALAARDWKERGGSKLNTENFPERKF